MKLENETLFVMTFCKSAIRQNLSVASFVDHPIHSLYSRHAVQNTSFDIELWTVKRGELKVDSIFLIFFNGPLSTGGVLLKKCFPVNSES